MNKDSNKKSGGFFNLIKNLFILLLFLQFAPTIITNIKNYIQDFLSPKAHVGCLNIQGFLGNSSFYINHIHNFLKNPEIKALLIKIDSHGGYPGTGQTIYNELNKFKKEKPVVVLVENICASAAYNIAAASNHIISNPSSLIGSIGVLLPLPNVKELLNDWKIKFNFIQSGKYKTAGNPLKSEIPEELEYLQKLSDEDYNQFIKNIAESRKLDIQKHKIWADGKVFLGTSALKLGLIDQLGSYQNAIDALKKLAKIETEIKFVYPKRASGLMRLFTGEDDYDGGEKIEFSSYIANLLNNIYIKFMAKQTENNNLSLT